MTKRSTLLEVLVFQQNLGDNFTAKSKVKWGGEVSILFLLYGYGHGLYILLMRQGCFKVVELLKVGPNINLQGNANFS